ncbi:MULTISPECIES: methyl-accepting chemotaxis protein [unclassified Duganella]|uniref:methyl-accepting chemotaxis protein n=1 Tax=unclassified Duganella TaxID=2636909 RepID=UPI0008933431|nr:MULTISPECIES: methyl-accepting chemotaxis protein [unclassified Duganella]OEZ63899.1 methyl-accepting chemotaxis protein I [Duganella sp. HH105]OFA06949.1 methyl-accepting chemotaxis protein I [Duganella sp. HH101]
MQTHSTRAPLRLWHKFLILSMIAVIIGSIPTHLYLHEAGKALDAYEGEQQGLPVVNTGLKMVQYTQQHRGLAALALGGVTAAEGQREAKQKEADAAYAEIDAVVLRLHDRDIDQAWSDAKRDWETLRTNVSGKRITVLQSYDDHTALVPKLLKVNDLLGDYYGLSLDPDKDTYQLIQAMFYQLPYLSEELGKTRAKGAGLLVKRTAQPSDRQQLASIAARVNDRLEQTLGAFKKAASANPEFEVKLGPAVREAAQAAAKITTLATSEIVKAEELSYSPEQYVAQSTAAIDLQFALNSAASKELDAILTEKIASFHKTRWMMILSMVGLLGAAGYIAMLISRSITVPLQNAIEVAQSVARGNLVNDFDVGVPNEVGQMLRALKEMNDSLRGIVGDVRLSIENINAATRDIASGNADVSARLESQASNLEETASSMEELTSTVRQNAENARQANELVLSASGVATKGGAVVAQVVQTMGEINESSRRIVDIIGVIDGIAFQTNILALNAAVEAARAGEQGRGFAVVASEVRNLAQRSAGAAKEIKGLIGTSVEKVEVGNRLADQAGLAMEEIVTSVKRITDIMSDIAQASTEQGVGIEQVNQAVTQMDDMTQQNAALVEQTAAASASLQEQAQSLVHSMSVFELGTGTAHRSGVASAPRAAVRARPGQTRALPRLERAKPRVGVASMAETSE